MMMRWVIEVYSLAAVIFLALLGVMVFALRKATGMTRRGQRHDALRTIATVNRRGGLSADEGTIVIPAGRRKQ